MACPNCGSTETTENEIDETLCCTHCGTVIDSYSIQLVGATEASQLRSYPPNKKEHQTILITEFIKVASFFQLPEDLVGEGKQLILQYRSSLSNRFSQEVAIAVVSIISGTFKPNWMLDDYIECFPFMLNLKQVRKAYLALVQRQVTVCWKSPQEQLNCFIDRIYIEVKKQVYKDIKSEIRKGRGFSKQALVAKTKQLIDLGDLYFLNTSKKARPTIIATALIAGLALRVGTSKQRISCLRWFDLGPFENYCFFQKSLLVARLFEYLDFLYTCAQHIPWINEPVKKDVHYYLNDILTLFGKQHDSEPTLQLSLEQYSPYCISKNTKMREMMENDIAIAQKHIQDGIIPTDKSSMVYVVYRLLEYGIDSQHLFNWSPGYIRGMLDSLSLRKSFGDCTHSEMNLDGEELNEKDMGDQEIAAYLR